MFGPKLRNLRDLRVRAGLTQEELATRANLHEKTIGAAERLACCPELRTVQRLADALGVAPSELWRSEPDAAVISVALYNLVDRTGRGCVDRGHARAGIQA